MAKASEHWRHSRCISERIIIEGELELLTPAHFGSGNAEGTTALELLRDAYDGLALLPGASIAGALRNYWRERTRGYGAVAEDSELFGAKRGRQEEMDGNQSLLIIEDAIGSHPQVEVREGVKIDSVTRTAEEDKLFSIELLQAGTRFPLHFELLIPEGRQEALCQELVMALQGFERGEIGLGARKRRGFGRCIVKQWRVRHYELTNPDGLLAWLAEGRELVPWEEEYELPQAWQERPLVADIEGNSESLASQLAEKLGVMLDDTLDKRHRFELIATFDLDGSLLVRSGVGQSDQGADLVHLHRLRYGFDTSEGEPVLPGTSLAGVLRARALRIVNTLTRNKRKATSLINEIFGYGPENAKDDEKKKRHRASHLVVHETVVQGVQTLVQTRIRIDRFTGGAMDNFLFTEAPVFATQGNNLELNLVLRQPQRYEIGLLLLLLKDLWSSDLPVGGQSSIGRGRLRGRSANLQYTKNGYTISWDMSLVKEQLQVTTDAEELDAWQSLEDFVQALNKQLAGR
jgi:CRISPR/Cas system CSM-associated protein Csm3 (group 7 of RAMP superfamily)